MSVGHDGRREGVRFPERDGRRSSQASGRLIFSEAARATDPQLASRIDSTDRWHKNYLGPARKLIEAGVRSPQEASLIAEAGLAAARGELSFVRNGDEIPLDRAFSSFTDDAFTTKTIEGTDKGRPGLSIPYRGRSLEADDLKRRLDAWESAGVIEASCSHAVKEVLAAPDWLDLSDLYIVLLGAASEMGPLGSLCSWGANIIAVDLPRPKLWERVIETARQGRGRLFIPSEKGDETGAVGADLLTHAPEVRTWLAGFDHSLTLGNYVYADGGDFVCLSAITDMLIDDVLRGSHNSTAYLATPTDVYAVPSEIASSAIAARPGAARGAVHQAARVLTANRLYSPNYARMVPDVDGRSWGISDCLVPQQGSNYSLAKAIQRWRASTAREQGHVSSANLAPATFTRSVVRNKVLAAAYAGAPSFGVEIFQSPTSAALMATLLVHDLRNDKAAANPAIQLQHPFELWTDAAAHGGIMRLPYEPRSVLPIAALKGLPATLRRSAEPD